MNLRTIIVDDQPTAAATLREMLGNSEPDVEIVGMASGGNEGVELINRLAPDLVFLDVEMPDLTGFEVVARIALPEMPVIVFVTGHDDFALKAFEAHALDYLLKPCQMARLRSAVKRARQQIQSRQGGEIEQKLHDLLGDLKRGLNPAERLAVKSNGRIVFLRLADIHLAEASDNYVKLYAGGESHMYRETLTALEGKLPPDRFLRISRSTIINVESVKELQPMFQGEYVVLLRNGMRATLTRRYREQLRHLGVTA
jgi:two-component system LytT family response regulator